MSAKKSVRRDVSLDEAQAVVAAHRDQEAKAKVAGVREAALGRCFKYRNSYGADGKWWLYFAVTSVEAHTAACIGVAFQTDKYGKVEIEPKARHYVYPGNGWVEISRAEFNRAAAKAQTSIANALRASSLPGGRAR